VNFSRDTLILLSLVSPETAAKVERYRSRMRNAGAISAQDDEQWQRRHKEFTAWRDAGYPLDDDEPESDAPAIRWRVNHYPLALT
jgi:hypothetical protein